MFSFCFTQAGACPLYGEKGRPRFFYPMEFLGKKGKNARFPLQTKFFSVILYLVFIYIFTLWERSCRFGKGN